MTLPFILNGEDVNARVRSVDRLSDILRENFGLLGVQSDCRIGRCGRCLILLNGRLCALLHSAGFQDSGDGGRHDRRLFPDRRISGHRRGIPLRRRRDMRILRLGQILAAAMLLERRTRPTSAEILEQLSVAPCRCTDPESLVRGVQAAAERRLRRMYHRAR